MHLQPLPHSDDDDDAVSNCDDDSMTQIHAQLGGDHDDNNNNMGVRDSSTKIIHAIWGHSGLLHIPLAADWDWSHKTDDSFIWTATAAIPSGTRVPSPFATDDDVQNNNSTNDAEAVVFDYDNTADSDEDAGATSDAGSEEDVERANPHFCNAVETLSAPLPSLGVQSPTTFPRLGLSFDSDGASSSSWGEDSSDSADDLDADS